MTGQADGGQGRGQLSLWSGIARLVQGFAARARGVLAAPALAADEPLPAAREQVAQCTLLELATESDGVVAFEVREGCVAEAEEKLDTLRRKIVASRPACTGTALDGETLD